MVTNFFVHSITFIHSPVTISNVYPKDFSIKDLHSFYVSFLFFHSFLPCSFFSSSLTFYISCFILSLPFIFILVSLILLSSLIFYISLSSFLHSNFAIINSVIYSFFPVFLISHFLFPCFHYIWLSFFLFLFFLSFLAFFFFLSFFFLSFFIFYFFLSFFPFSFFLSWTSILNSVQVQTQKLAPSKEETCYYAAKQLNDAL